MKPLWLNLVCVLFALLAACQNLVELESPDTPPPGPPTWLAVFDGFWNGMNNNYVFWDLDTTDWDAVYARYQPKFAALNIQKRADADSAFRYFFDATQGLRDGHYALTVHSPFGDSIQFMPADTRHLSKYGMDPFAFRKAIGSMGIEAARSEYYTPEFLNSAALNEKPCNVPIADLEVVTVPGISNGVDLKICGGTMAKGSIAYFSFSRFLLTELSKQYGRAARDALNVFSAFVDRLDSSGLKGVIVDLRGNTGGDVADLSLLWGKMIDAPLTYGASRTKMGDNRLDVGPWLPAQIFPDPERGRALSVPVVLLVNEMSVSAAEVSALIVSELPNGIVVGDTTYGAFGGIAANSMFNSGSFTAPYGAVQVYTASIASRSADGTVYEGKGFPPDSFVPFDYDAYSRGSDARLDKAIELILER
jgi:hypothetical protein